MTTVDTHTRFKLSGYFASNRLVLVGCECSCLFFPPHQAQIVYTTKGVKVLSKGALQKCESLRMRLASLAGSWGSECH